MSLYYWIVPGVFCLGMLTILSNHFAGRGFPIEAGLIWVAGLALNLAINVAFLTVFGTYIASLASSIAYSAAAAAAHAPLCSGGRWIPRAVAERPEASAFLRGRLSGAGAG